jgi:putative hemolysin
MSRSFSFALAAGLLATLAACSSAPKKLNATPDGVAYTYEDDEDLNAVTNKAAKYCAEHGGTARLKNISRNGDEKVAMFDCG